MRVAIIGEKPLLASAFIRNLPVAFPESRGTVPVTVFANPIVHLNPLFSYPRGLSWSDYPWVGEPVYKPISLTSWLKPRYTLPDPDGRWRDLPGQEPCEGFANAEERAVNAVRGADLILVAMAYNPSNILTVHRLLGQLFQEGVPDGRVGYPLIFRSDDEAIMRVDDEGIVECIRKARDGWPPFAETKLFLPYAMARRRFDYCFGVNALAVLGRTMREAGLEVRDYVPSKHALQLLYTFRTHPKMTESLLVHIMWNWKGTGKYRQRGWWNAFGSPASRTTIIEQLVTSGLVERASDERGTLSLSAAGKRFLDLLHPDCEDPDLTFRLPAWCHLPIEESHPKIDRYIRTFFGKQKRFLSRNGASVPVQA